MNNLLCRICTGFIWNKEKRKRFRQEHLKYSKKHIYIKIESLENQLNSILTRLSHMNLVAEKINNINYVTSILPEILNRTMQTNLSTAFMHQKTFLPFKNKHTGKDIVIIATGPTAKKYKPIPNTVHIGVNRALDLGIDLDYIFIQDYSGATDYLSRINTYRPNECTKFYGLTTEYEPDKKRVIPETDTILSSALRYRTDWISISGFASKFAYDISTQPLGCFGTIVFPALQFALWTNPKRIYLVGCDTSRSGYFDNETQNSNYLVPNDLIPCYKQFKEFAQQYYPDVEIISINPVGLKGIFKDVTMEDLQ